MYTLVASSPHLRLLRKIPKLIEFPHVVLLRADQITWCLLGLSKLTSPNGTLHTNVETAVVHRSARILYSVAPLKPSERISKIG